MMQERQRAHLARSIIAALLAFCSVMAAAPSCRSATTTAKGLTDRPVTRASSKGPVKLGLSVLRTKIAVGEPLWVKLTLTDIGRDDDYINVDKLFDQGADVSAEIGMNAGRHRDVYLSLRDREGKELAWPLPRFSDGFCPENNTTPWDEPESSKSPSRDSSSPSKVNYARPVLGPGETVTTHASFVRGPCPVSRISAEFAAGYSEIATKLSTPGQYRLSAVYDFSPKARGRKEMRFSSDVRVETPAIEITVIPRKP